jgi:hypothetical protein
VRRSSERLRRELADTEAQLHNATHADVLGPLVSAVDVDKAWQNCDCSKAAVIDALMIVTLLALSAVGQTV